MSKLELPKCPHCGEKVSFLRSGYIMSKPDYKCESCDKVSSVTIKHSLYGLIRACGIIAAIALLVSVFLGWRSFAIDVMFLSVLACEILAPFYSELSEKKEKKEKATEEKT